MGTSSSRSAATKEPNAPKVFISYAREDEPAARRLSAELGQAGAQPWLDKDHLLPGQVWRQVITAAITATDYVIVLLSATSVDKKGYVQKEVRIALDILDELPPDRIFLIPARLDDCHPKHPRLADLHWADLFPFWDQGLTNILSAMNLSNVRTEGPSTKGATPTPPQARSVAEKLAQAVDDIRQQQTIAADQATQERQYAAQARQKAPNEFHQVAMLLRDQGLALNAKRSPGIPEHSYEPINHVLQAGFLAAQLQPTEGFEAFSFDLIVGLHPNAHIFMAKVPSLESQTWTFIARRGDTGFFWSEERTHQQYTPQQIIDLALHALADLEIRWIVR